MIVGCFILGGALILNSQATTIGMVYASRILMGISLSFIGVLLNVVLVSNWFRRKRGIALGIVLTGTSFGGVFIPLIAAPLIANYGWRTAMIAVSLIIWLILLPAIIFLVKAKPSEINLFQDGEKNDKSPITNDESQKTVQHSAFSTQRSSDLTLSQAVKTPLFWIFALCAALIFYPLFVSTQQLILYVRSPKIGVSPETAAFLQSLMSALSICGKFLFGFISDKFSPTRVMLLCCTVMFAATLVLLNFSVGTILLFLIPFGLGYGGTFVLLQRLVADYFGTKDYAKILGAITVIETIGASIGGRITGHIADLNGGDYTQAFYGVIVATGLALLLTVWLNLLIKNGKEKSA
jgi:MFS family permease